MKSNWDFETNVSIYDGIKEVIDYKVK